MDNKIENSTIENFKLRPRTRGGFSTYNKANCINNTPGNFSNNTVWIEKKIKQEDSINKIALQYNVSVSDIKRFNNILNDQEIYALKSIRIPVSELKRDILLKKMSRENIDLSDNFENFDDEKARLISDDSEKEQSVEDIFVKTDTVVAQVRDALPDDEMHVGTYHFVDAKSPNSTNGIWMIILAVIIIFVIVPLLLTFIEEENHLEHSTGKDNDMLYHFKNN
ncbi:LysM domain-containing protein [Strongyloides ratti]|uniref:LysM domain-containing protein n=1 Tax=Strongyloides ratti TaxID=34506 RepID=A0A090LHU9_STRRB|nr:LysM domain-containing protein [Strongyloides ratti]CEF67095.1 LysM domain-containing protein [Strongyloides ratti]